MFTVCVNVCFCVFSERWQNGTRETDFEGVCSLLSRPLYRSVHGNLIIACSMSTLVASVHIVELCVPLFAHVHNLDLCICVNVLVFVG